MSSIIPENNSTLYIDIGNSSIKAAYRDEFQWERPDSQLLSNASDLVDWINRHQKNFESIVIASVVEETTSAILNLLESENVRVFSIGDIPSDLLDYKTTDTLGIDRFFSCYGAVAQTSKPAVVIDAGTACTIDYMSGDFVFRGGVIMPGIGILEQSLRAHAPGLPAVLPSIPDQWPGKTTKDSLRWGLYGGFRDAILAVLENYEEHYEDFDLMITGGSAEWVSQVLGRESKVHPMLIFEGMHFFLEDYL